MLDKLIEEYFSKHHPICIFGCVLIGLTCIRVYRDTTNISTLTDPDGQEILNSDPDYFTKLDIILKNYNSPPKMIHIQTHLT